MSKVDGGGVPSPKFISCFQRVQLVLLEDMYELISELVTNLLKKQPWVYGVCLNTGEPNCNETP